MSLPELAEGALDSWIGVARCFLEKKIAITKGQPSVRVGEAKSCEVVVCCPRATGSKGLSRFSFSQVSDSLLCSFFGS